MNETNKHDKSLMYKIKYIVQELVHIRKNSVFSQQDIATALSIDRRYIMSLEAGKQVNIDVIDGYAGILGFDIEIKLKQL